MSSILSGFLSVVKGDLDQDGEHRAPAENNNPNQPLQASGIDGFTTFKRNSTGSHDATMVDCDSRMGQLRLARDHHPGFKAYIVCHRHHQSTEDENTSVTITSSRPIYRHSVANS